MTWLGHARQACVRGWDACPTSQCAHVTKFFLALCHDKDLHVAIGFPGKLGGLGRDRDFLCCDRDILAPCRDRDLCHDRV